jgi:cytochrome c biogenesis protein CcmG/thiol:disulfide interchange protein DsbE
MSPRRNTTRASLVALLLALFVGGCAGEGIVTRSPAPAGTEVSQTEPVSTPSIDLAAQKKAAGIADCPTSDPSVPALDQGLPDITLPCLGGGRSVRLAGLRGQPMIISVWAQWCPPCRQEAPYLSEVAARRPAGIMMLGIDFVDPRPDLAIEFARLSGWKYPQLQDLDKTLSSSLQVSAPPQTIFVDAAGKVVYRHAGPLSSAAELRNLAKQHLGVQL